METVEFGTLADLQVLHSGGQDAMWVFADAAGRKASFKVGRDALALILQLASSLAAQPSAQRTDAPGMTRALPAQNLSVGPGRNPKEVALHIHLGSADLAYLIPLDAVVIALGTLVSGLYPDAEGTAH